VQDEPSARRDDGALSHSAALLDTLQCPGSQRLSAVPIPNLDTGGSLVRGGEIIKDHSTSSSGLTFHWGGGGGVVVAREFLTSDGWVVSVVSCER
jgi:hypothetical protein